MIDKIIKSGLTTKTNNKMDGSLWKPALLNFYLVPVYARAGRNQSLHVRFMNNTLQFVLAGICFAKPCGTLGKQQRIKLSWGKLANSSKHSLLHGGGLPWLHDESPSRYSLKKLYSSHGRHESHGSLVPVFRSLAIYWNVGVSAQTTEGSLSWKSVRF